MENRHHKNYNFGEFSLESELQILHRSGKNIHLAKRPFDVLVFLIENRDRIVSRNELLDKFWDGHDVYDDALRKCIGTIRKTLNDIEKSPRFIETKRGSGYHFIGIVSESKKEIDEKAAKVHRLEENVNKASRVENEEKAFTRFTKTFGSEFKNRSILIAIFGVVLISFVALAFYANRPQPKFADTKTLTESITSKRSIAILPLKNLTGDAANDYLSDGVTESLINEVSRVESLKVISRSSAFQFKDKNASAQEIGATLGVETILEGGLKQSGDQLRVEVRLVNTKDGSVIWVSDSQQKKLADVFTIQDGITCQIVTELKVKLCGEVPPSARYTQNVKAYQLYLKGLYFRNRLETKNAIDFFQSSLAG